MYYCCIDKDDHGTPKECSQPAHMLFDAMEILDIEDEDDFYEAFRYAARHHHYRT